MLLYLLQDNYICRYVIIYIIIDNLCVAYARLFWSVQCKCILHFLHVGIAKTIHLQRVLQVCLLVFLVVIYIYIHIHTYIAL